MAKLYNDPNMKRWGIPITESDKIELKVLAARLNISMNQFLSEVFDLSLHPNSIKILSQNLSQPVPSNLSNWSIYIPKTQYVDLKKLSLDLELNIGQLLHLCFDQYVKHANSLQSQSSLPQDLSERKKILLSRIIASAQ